MASPRPYEIPFNSPEIVLPLMEFYSSISELAEKKASDDKCTRFNLLPGPVYTTGEMYSVPKEGTRVDLEFWIPSEKSKYRRYQNIPWIAINTLTEKRINTMSGQYRTYTIRDFTFARGVPSGLAPESSVRPVAKDFTSFETKHVPATGASKCITGKPRELLHDIQNEQDIYQRLRWAAGFVKRLITEE